MIQGLGFRLRIEGGREGATGQHPPGAELKPRQNFVDASFVPKTAFVEPRYSRSVNTRRRNPTSLNVLRAPDKTVVRV